MQETCPLLGWAGSAFLILTAILLSRKSSRRCHALLFNGIGAALIFSWAVVNCLWSSATLNIFFVVLSAKGWWTWRKVREEET